MVSVSINYMAILVASVLSMILGMVWYGPIFGRQWSRLSGMSLERAGESGMATGMAIGFCGWLLTGYVLRHAIVFSSAYTGTMGIEAGLMGGFFNWLGFMVPVLIQPMLWEGKSWELFLLSGGYFLVSLLGMGVLLAIWI